MVYFIGKINHDIYVKKIEYIIDAVSIIDINSPLNPHLDQVHPLAKKATTVVRINARIMLNIIIGQSPCPRTPGINKNIKGIIKVTMLIRTASLATSNQGVFAMLEATKTATQTGGVIAESAAK